MEIMRNQLDKNIEKERATGPIQGLIGIATNDNILDSLYNHCLRVPRS